MRFTLSRTSRGPLALIIASILAPATGTALAQEQNQAEPITQQAFFECKARLEQQAIDAGVSQATASQVMAQVEHLDRVIELDRRQPEFTTTFADYLNRRVNEARVSKGREMLAEHRDLLERVTDETGVPAPYLVAFWGLETNFGSYFGKMSVPSALTTLACDARRSTFFTQQLIAALRIIDEGAIPADQMEGSWAGAMGHVQFMPTVFLQHAVDADGDGRRDLWNSLPDAMMSAGKFLQSMGWDGDYRWGREVLLPDSFDYNLADGRRLALSEWRNMGITDAFGNALSRADIKAKLVVPAGHQGPAFLVYDNFRVIMGWNRSEFYAIAVGHLADRVAGAGKLQNPPPEDAPALSRDNIMELQEALTDRGFDTGKPDGILGPATRSAIRKFQAASGMVADGYPGQAVLARLNVSTGN
ncbi:membrane-bound lytic murein transglycosylase B [Marinobacter pelagius]|uniref:Membrane-bound lytic murein transglycosylase B n=1 Tax=Marinobacter pelagius TaxID=379482 RepID=A0A1I4WQR1_9GAMM|nr:membrane-bound lytic murein transglycosylase B [Marinobacter pelagius]